MGLQDNKFEFNVNRLIKSFIYAYQGIYHTLISENNFQIEFSIAIVTILLSFFLKISKYDWIIVLLCIGIVLTLELINTAIESVVDLVTNSQYHKKAKIAKDCSAGAVLVTSIVVAIIGIIVLLPYIIK